MPAARRSDLLPPPRALGWLGDRAGFATHQQRLLANAEGTVVEIGAGTGLNFRHYSAGPAVMATEPDPYMLKAASRAARRARARLTVRQALAASLPVPNASVETVVSTLVLCSVPDQAASWPRPSGSSGLAASCWS